MSFEHLTPLAHNLEMIEQPTEKTIQKAAELLRQGKLVAFPTETVYGLGGAALNPEAVKQIFKVKGRPTNHPLIVHLGNVEQLPEWAISIPETAWRLAEHFWPGPLTLILSKAPAVLDLVTGGQDTVGIRIPAHPVAQALLKAYGTGVVAPSANRFGHVSPTQAEHVLQELGTDVNMILDGGACQLGIESTILDLSGGQPQILRPGSITASQISDVIGPLKQSTTLAGSPRVSGSMLSHYAPQTPLQIMTPEQVHEILGDVDGEVAVLTVKLNGWQQTKIHWYSMPLDPVVYAHDLYAKLREIDQQGYNLILVESPPTGEHWLAVWDRLQKASKKM